MILLLPLLLRIMELAMTRNTATCRHLLSRYCGFHHCLPPPFLPSLVWTLSTTITTITITLQTRLNWPFATDTLIPTQWSVSPVATPYRPLELPVSNHGTVPKSRLGSKSKKWTKTKHKPSKTPRPNRKRLVPIRTIPFY